MTNPVIDSNGNKRWYNFRGQLHREDGPACEYKDGSKTWYKEGLIHREDGPAYEYPGAYKEWYMNGILHRLDGPAIEWDSGLKTKEWYVDNAKVTEEDYPQAVLLYKCKQVLES